MMVRFRARTGFTLIELLVVVAIIALLISILLPSLGKARATARMVKCQSVWKQFGTAHHMYANANEDWFVPVEISGFGGWYQWIQFRQMAGMPVGSPWRFPEGLVCPDVPADRAHLVQFNVGFNGTNAAGLVQEPNSPWRGGDKGPSLNSSGTGTMVRVFRGKVRNPSGKLHMVDAAGWRVSKGGSNYLTRWDLFPELNPNVPQFAGGFIHTVSYRHNEGANALMFDGHVEYRSKHEVFFRKADGTPDHPQTDNLWFAYK